MSRITLALIGLIVLGGCQNSEEPPTVAERCSNLDMQIVATQQNDTIQQDAKDQMIESFEAQKAELNCP